MTAALLQRLRIQAHALRTVAGWLLVLRLWQRVVLVITAVLRCRPRVPVRDQPAARRPVLEKLKWSLL